MVELYRITGVNEKGERRVVSTKNGPAIYTRHSSAKKAFSQVNSGRWWHQRYLNDFRIERADTNWQVV